MKYNVNGRDWCDYEQTQATISWDHSCYVWQIG
jgi:hypothetical protein